VLNAVAFPKEKRPHEFTQSAKIFILIEFPLSIHPQSIHNQYEINIGNLEFASRRAGIRIRD
jgi:hypothetical protein